MSQHRYMDPIQSVCLYDMIHARMDQAKPIRGPYILWDPCVLSGFSCLIYIWIKHTVALCFTIYQYPYWSAAANIHEQWPTILTWYHGQVHTMLVVSQFSPIWFSFDTHSMCLPMCSSFCSNSVIWTPCILWTYVRWPMPRWPKLRRKWAHILYRSLMGFI